MINIKKCGLLEDIDITTYPSTDWIKRSSYSGIEDIMNFIEDNHLYDKDYIGRYCRGGLYR